MTPSSADNVDFQADASVGLGVDLVNIARVQEILDRTPAFARRAFSEAESSYAWSTPNPAAHFATRFAAKEAVLKALGTGFSKGIRPTDVEVGRMPSGRPYAVLHGRAKEIADDMGVRELPLSLSYTHTDAVACAMAITDASLAAMAARKDPMQELTRQFKEVRDILDDLPVNDASRGSDHE